MTTSSKDAPHMPLSSEEIQNRFGFHPGTEETIPKHELVREAFIAMAEFLKDKIPEGRALSTAMTNLQVASMWAHFGIAELAPVVNPLKINQEERTE